MEELELREREKWVDAVKGLAIYLVILGMLFNMRPVKIIIMQEIVFFKLYIAFICRYL